MKKIIFLISISFFLITCRQFKPPVPQFVISGQIENFEGNSFKLSHPLDDIIIDVNEDGSFSDTISDFVDGYYNMRIGKEYTNIYLKDGFDLFFDIDIVDFDESISYKGIGASENNFLAQKILKGENSDFNLFYKLSEDTFLFKIDSLSDTRAFELDNFISSDPNIDKDFIKFEKAKIYYFAPSTKESYQNISRYYSKNDEFKVSNSFYDYRKDIQLENNDLLGLKEYNTYVLKLLYNKIDPNNKMEKGFSVLRVIDKEIKDNLIQKHFIYKTAKQQLPKIEKLDEYWALVSYRVTAKREYKELNKLKREMDKIKVGKDSPNVSFKDIDGKSFSLEDYKGKYLYIDCWAVWCGPCVRESPFLKKLELKYAEKEISFIKLSFDTDVDSWKDYITKNDILKNSFILEDNFKSEFAETFKINSIPRFILLDKDLKIIDKDAKRPSDDKLVTQLDELLK